MGRHPPTNLKGKRFFFGLKDDSKETYNEYCADYPLDNESLGEKKLFVHQLLEHVNHSTFRKNYDDMENVSFYKEQLHQKWREIHNHAMNKHNQYVLNHPNMKENSSRYNSHISSILHRIYNKIKWHRKTSQDVKNEIWEILKGVIGRTHPQTCIELAEIFEEYQHRIATNKFDIGQVPGIEYRIKLKPGVQPKKFPYSRLPKEHDEEIKKTIDVLLKAGLIRPYYGPWGFRAFCVYNNDGSTRMVNDFVWINARSDGDTYPCQSVPDMLSRFGGSVLFSCFDINKAFFNIKVAPDCQKYTAFTTRYGTYCWNVMPFGGKSAPSTWARASDIIFKQCVDLIKYVDDFIIATKDQDGNIRNECKDPDFDINAYKIGINTERKHIESIRQFFDCCSRYNIKVKLSKCKFFVRQVKFLGNIIDAKGRRPDDGYVRNLLQYTRPMDKQELRAYLGALNWIAKHVYKFRKLLIPLQKLTCKDTKFEWTKKHQEAFEKVQQYIQTTEILHHPDFNEKFYLFVDASKYYYGGVLLQKRYGKYVVIDMFSKSWTQSQLKHHITTKELFALVDSIKIWKHYLYTNQFVIHSDSRNLLHLFDRVNGKRSSNPYHEQWVFRLSQYDFMVQHIAGVHNCVADYLSRYIKDTTALPKYVKGSKPMSEYNKHKRFKFKRGKKKLLCNRDINGTEHVLYRTFLPSTQGKYRLPALGALRNSSYYCRDFETDDLFTNWTTTQFETDPINIKQSVFQHQLALNVVEAWKSRNEIQSQFPLRDGINLANYGDKPWKTVRRAHFLLLQDKKRTLNQRKSSRLAAKPAVDYVNERIFDNPTTVIPEEHISNSDLSEVSQRSSISNKTQRDILSSVDRGNVSGIIEEGSSDEEANDEFNHNIGNWPEANDPFLVDENYNLNDVIYSNKLIEDPAIKTLDVFSIDSIRHNQALWPEYQIIMNHLRGIDTRDDFKKLGGRTRNDVQKGLYKIHDEVLFYERNGVKRICLPPEHRKAALEYLHTNLLYGQHNNYNALVEEVKKRFYWSGYDEEIKEYVKQCKTCQLSKRYPNKKQGLAKLFNAKYPNHMVAIDHTGPLPTTAKGYRYITTYYDRYSGYTRSVPCESIDAFTTAINFINEWVTLFGAPAIILTDNGTDFRSQLFTHLTKKIMNIDVRSTSAYHASCNGAVERFNRTLKTGLRSISADKRLDFAKGDSWDLFVKYINSVHNNRKSIRFRYKYCPNEVFMGRSILLPMDYKLHENVRLEADTLKRLKAEGYFKNMYKMINSIAPQELEQYHRSRKKAMDKDRKRPKYKIGDLVMYWIGPYPWFGSEKVQIHWQGPYRILQVWNKRCNYTLQSIRFPKVFVNANIKRIAPFHVDKRRQVNPDYVKEDDLREFKLASREFNEELVPDAIDEKQSEYSPSEQSENDITDIMEESDQENEEIQG